MAIITSMVNILVNDTNFDANWAYPSLNEYFTKDSKVVVVPFMHSDEYRSDEEEWDYYFKKGGKIYEKIVAPFKNYGIKEKNISFFHLFKDSNTSLETLLSDADVLYLYASQSESMMQNIVDAGIGRLLVQFDGVMICNHAASHVLLEHFESPYEWEEEEIDGLGLLSDFALMSDYVEDVQHLRRLIRNIEEKGRAVFAFGKDGGVVIHHGHYELLGNAFTVSFDDLDAIYRAYEDAKSRYDYYGSNGLWDE